MAVTANTITSAKVCRAPDIDFVNSFTGEFNRLFELLDAIGCQINLYQKQIQICERSAVNDMRLSRRCIYPCSCRKLKQGHQCLLFGSLKASGPIRVGCTGLRRTCARWASLRTILGEPAFDLAFRQKGFPCSTRCGLSVGGILKSCSIRTAILAMRPLLVAE